MSDKRREPPKKSAGAAATVAAPIPPGDLGTLVYAPGGEDWSPDFTNDGESRLLDLIDVDTTWDPRTLASTTQETRVLCVASDGAGAGTGVAIAQIARTLARAGRDVLVIDASVARPLLTKPFGYQPDEGLVDMVLFGTSPGAAVRKTASDKIRVLTVGSPPLEAAEIWKAKELSDVLTAFRSEWNAIVVHAPLYRDDGRVCEVVCLADALLVVLPAARAAAVERVASEIATLGASPRFLGIVATGRRGEVTPAPARKPVVAPAPTPAIAPAPAIAEEPRAPTPKTAPTPAPKPSPAPEAAVRTKAAPAPSPEKAPTHAATPPAEPKTPRASESNRADFDGATPDDFRVEATDDRAPRPRGPSRLLIIALLLGVGALVAGAALGRFGSLGFGSRPSPSKTSTARTTPDAPRVAQRKNIDDHSASAAAARSPITAPDSSRLAANAAPDTFAARSIVAPDTSARRGVAAAETSVAAPPRPKPAPVVAKPESKIVITPSHPADASGASGPDAWGVHVSSFPQREMAVRDSVAWRKKGYVVHVIAKDIPEKGLWYRIVLGEFAAKPEAQAFAEEVRAREGLDYGLVMKVPAR